MVRWRLCEAFIDFDEIKRVSQKSNFLENNNLKKTYKLFHFLRPSLSILFYDFIFRKFYKLLRV